MKTIYFLDYHLKILDVLTIGNSNNEQFPNVSPYPDTRVDPRVDMG